MAIAEQIEFSRKLAKHLPSSCRTNNTPGPTIMKQVWQIVDSMSEATWTKINVRNVYKIYSGYSYPITIHKSIKLRP